MVCHLIIRLEWCCSPVHLPLNPYYPLVSLNPYLSTTYRQNWIFFDCIINNSTQNTDVEEVTETLSPINPDLLIGLSQDSGSHSSIPEDILLESTVDDHSIVIFSPPTTPDPQPNNVPPRHSSTDPKSDNQPSKITTFSFSVLLPLLVHMPTTFLSLLR